MAERAIIYFSELDSEKEVFIEVVIENFPVVPKGTTISIKQGDTFILEAEVSLYCVTSKGLEVDAGEVMPHLFQAMLPKCTRVDQTERYRYPDSITLG